MCVITTSLSVDLPGSPRDVKTLSVGSTTAKLVWLEPENLGNPPLAHYLVIVTSDDDNFNITSETNATNVTGLLPNTNYEVTVTSVSPLPGIRSDPSLPVNFTTNTTGYYHCGFLNLID